MSERLEIIKFLRESEKTVAPGMKPSELISRKDVDWLIQQAERVEKLEKEKDEWKDTAQSYYMTNQELREQNKRYREALEFYANKINYLTFIENGKSNIEHDQGEKARKALEGEE